jgi:hypothetical protein
MMTALSGYIESGQESAVESHISRKTSEMWGTRVLLPNQQFVQEAALSG